MEARTIDLGGFIIGGFVVLLIWMGAYAIYTAEPRYDKWVVLKLEDCHTIAKDFGPMDYCVTLGRAKEMAANSNKRDTEAARRQAAQNNKQWEVVSDEL